MESEVGAGRTLKKSGWEEEKGRRNIRNGREVRLRKWREWKRRDQGRLDRGQREETQRMLSVGKENLRKEDVRM